MRGCLVLAVFTWTQSVVAATFVGELTARYEVTEYLDGTYTVVEQSGPMQFILTTDYSQIDWDIIFDVDLLMAGGPTQSFETRFCDSPPLSDSGGDRIMVLEGGPKDERVTAGSATSLAAF